MEWFLEEERNDFRSKTEKLAKSKDDSRRSGGFQKERFLIESTEDETTKAAFAPSKEPDGGGGWPT